MDISKVETSPKKRAQSRDWYNQNREEYNAKRRERYAANKDAREKARMRAARYRDQKPAVQRRLTRELNGTQVKVFSTGQVAEKIGRTPQMLRNWESNGLIPECVFEGKQRLYTTKQVELIIHLAYVISQNGGAWTGDKVDKAVARVHKRW